MASPVGHSLCGVLLGEALRKRGSGEPSKRRIGSWLVYALLANFPDVDFLIGYLAFGDPGRLHSGFTHSILFCVAIAGLAAILGRRVPLFPGFWTCLALLGSHLALDAASGHLFLGPGYGVMLFYPFSMERIQTPIALFWGPKHRSLAELFGTENLLGVLWEIVVFLPPTLIVALRALRQSRLEEHPDSRP